MRKGRQTSSSTAVPADRNCHSKMEGCRQVVSQRVVRVAREGLCSSDSSYVLCGFTTNKAAHKCLGCLTLQWYWAYAIRMSGLWQTALGRHHETLQIGLARPTLHQDRSMNAVVDHSLQGRLVGTRPSGRMDRYARYYRSIYPSCGSGVLVTRSFLEVSTTQQHKTLRVSQYGQWVHT